MGCDAPLSSTLYSHSGCCLVHIQPLSVRGGNVLPWEAAIPNIVYQHIAQTYRVTNINAENTIITKDLDKTNGNLHVTLKGSVSLH
jgi:hypothetical protein